MKQKKKSIKELCLHSEGDMRRINLPIEYRPIRVCLESEILLFHNVRLFASSVPRIRFMFTYCGYENDISVAFSSLTSALPHPEGVIYSHV